jgi:ABC-type phosphate transport system, periplasmic component
MKNRILLILVCLISYANFLFPQQGFQGINEIDADNYPRIDGSTSTEPLNYIIAAKLLGLEYEWIVNTVRFKNHYELPTSFRDKFQLSQTHGSILNLIDNQTDIILVARKMSEDEKDYAADAGVSLIETPIALDALDFILNYQNTVNSLTVEQIQNIYLGNITNWSDVGGANEEIIPFIRNENSGSQEMMNEIVMNNVDMPDWTVSYADELTLGAMYVVYSELMKNPYGICFTPHYYKEYMVSDGLLSNIKTLAVNEIMPNKNSIKNNTYPFIADVYVSIRSDLDQNSMAYKLYEWLQTPSGKSVIEESGYVPYGNYENSINQISNLHIQISPNPTEGIIEIRGIEDNDNLSYEIYNSTGQITQSGKLKQTIDLSSGKGLYILTIMQNRKVIAQEKIIVK